MTKLNTHYLLVFILLTLFPFKSLAEDIDGITEEQLKMIETLPPDQRGSILEKMKMSQDIKKEIDDAFEKPNVLIKRPEKNEKLSKEDECLECIYGYDFFEFSPSTFAPTDSIAISSSYVLGPGDMLEVNLYGNQEVKKEAYISREGEIFIPLLGPVNLIGLTFEEANALLQKKVKAELIGTEISVSLKELRSISIYLLGEAYKPGQYLMSGLSTVTNALFVAGGVNKNGSLRNIQIKRNNKVISTYDFYDFLLNGSIGTEVNLQDGDVIFIPFIEKRVKVGGAFKRPYIYEFREGETVSDAIKFAGGVTSQVLPTSSVELNSVDPDLFIRKLYYISLGSNELNRKLQNEKIQKKHKHIDSPPFQ